MKRWSILGVTLLLCSAGCFGQVATGDSPTLQELLSEVRQLRQDVQATFIAAQRAQILIYRLQGQEAAVARASQRLDEAREKLARTEDERKRIAAQVKRMEDFLGDNDNSGTERKQVETNLAQLKARLESLDVDEQQNQSREIEAEQLLRTEEARLGDLRDQLDRLDKTLENASRKP
jgi:chromosome segregation ATPase